MATIYIKISKGRFYAKNLKTDAVFDAPSVIVYKTAGDRKTVLAVGQDAADLSLEEGFIRVWPFDDHPRVLVGDFETAQALFKYAIQSIAGRAFLAPRIIVHIDYSPAGGVSAIEKRVFLELGESAGARDVKLMTPETVIESGMGQAELEESLKKSFS